MYDEHYTPNPQPRTPYRPSMWDQPAPLQYRTATLLALAVVFTLTVVGVVGTLAYYLPRIDL